MDKTTLEGTIASQIRSLKSSNGKEFIFKRASQKLKITGVENLNITVQSKERDIIDNCRFIGTAELTTPDGGNSQLRTHKIEGYASISGDDTVEVNENIGIID